MAMAQARHVAALLTAADPGAQVSLAPVESAADRWRGALAEAGGKGLFTTRIDAMLHRGEVDAAVHCLKDVPGDVPLPDGLRFAAYLPRGEVRDALLLRGDGGRAAGTGTPAEAVPAGPAATAGPGRAAGGPGARPRGADEGADEGAAGGAASAALGELPPRAVVGTSSVRRRAQLLRIRPDLRIVPVRGAAGSRIAALDAGAPRGNTPPLDALVLALPGLHRIGQAGRARRVFGTDEILPAVGAGVLVVECRTDDAACAALLARLDDARTRREATAERALLHALRGHCNSPIAALASTAPDGSGLDLRARVFDGDGDRVARAEGRTDTPPGQAGRRQADGARDLGESVAADLLARGARALIDAAAR